MLGRSIEDGERRGLVLGTLDAEQPFLRRGPPGGLAGFLRRVVLRAGDQLGDGELGEVRIGGRSPGDVGTILVGVVGEVSAQLVEHGEGVPLGLEGEHLRRVGDGSADEERGGLPAFRIVLPMVLALEVDADDLALVVVDGEGDAALVNADHLLLVQPIDEVGRVAPGLADLVGVLLGEVHQAGIPVDLGRGLRRHRVVLWHRIRFREVGFLRSAVFKAGRVEALGGSRGLALPARDAKEVRRLVERVREADPTIHHPELQEASAFAGRPVMEQPDFLALQLHFQRGSGLAGCVPGEIPGSFFFPSRQEVFTNLLHSGVKALEDVVCVGVVAH